MSDYNRDLLNAAKNGDADKVKQWIKAAGMDVNASDDSGNTSLHLAADLGHVQVVKALINLESDVNAKNNDGWTALHKVAKAGHIKIATILLINDANPDIENNDGDTAWDLIKGKKRMEFVFNEALKEWYKNQ